MVRTRFAPSPTGYLHIGGVRTALFNWLFTRHHGGQFLLRVDDTDQQRNVEQALQPILDGFRWLGIDWDEGPEVGGPHAPYYQSQRVVRHRAAVEELLARGCAYHDYARKEELQAERDAAEQQKQSYVYSRRWRADTPEQARRFEAEGREGVVRLLMPREGSCRFTDLIRGDVEFQWSQEQDHVVQRADGSCLYHLASVVDDFDMEITHVIRAVEHLSNTPRQIFIAQSLGYPQPQYAHLPYVAEPGSRNKMSKRKIAAYLKQPDFRKLYEQGKAIADTLGLATSEESFNPVLVDFYRQVGYLPDALVNYLLLLGWSLDDKTEQFTREEMIRHFSLDRVNKAPASFDPQKLAAFQQRAMLEVSLDRKVELAEPFLRGAGWLPRDGEEPDRQRVRAVVAAAGDRLKIAGDILQFSEFFLADEHLTYDPQDVDKRLRRPGAADLLRQFRGELAAAEPFTAERLETLLHQFIRQRQLKVNDIIHALRLAVTGKSQGVGMFDCLAILGRDAVLARIDRALGML